MLQLKRLIIKIINRLYMENINVNKIESTEYSAFTHDQSWIDLAESNLKTFTKLSSLDGSIVPLDSVAWDIAFELSTNDKMALFEYGDYDQLIEEVISGFITKNRASAIILPVISIGKEDAAVKILLLISRGDKNLCVEDIESSKCINLKAYMEYNCYAGGYHFTSNANESVEKLSASNVSALIEGYEYGGEVYCISSKAQIPFNNVIDLTRYDMLKCIN